MANHRLHPTLADYVAIAINPVLVMGLVGSLIYFLLEVLYQGAYPDRLQFCLTMFIFAIVLVSRIAMEEGFEHAAPFGVALAVVVALALGRFVEYGSGVLANFSWIINWSLMGITWWCAHQLTWDSTILDDGETGESQGLLETVGIDRTSGEPVSQPSAADVASDAIQQRRGILAGWEKVLNRKGKPHAPGVWVVYFSLASLPIFGIGQLLIPAANKSSRRYVFGLLCVYVACGLGLLLTTSFLALRRYLRRRRLEMPPLMAGSWLVTGGVLIVVLLVLVALLPRPNPEYSISELPLRFSSREHNSSQLALGKEGVRDPQAGAGSGADHAREPTEQNQSESADAGQASGADGETTATGASGQGRPGEGKEPSGGSQGSSAGGQGQSKPAQGGQANSQPGKSQPTGGKPESSRPNPSKQGESQSNDNANADTHGARPKPDRENTRPAAGASAKPAPGPQSQSSPAPVSSPPSSSLPSPLLFLDFLTVILKWIFYGVVVGAMIYFGWQQREALAAMLSDALAQCREFWSALFGGRKQKKTFVLAAPPGVALEEKRSLRFGDFLDPFAEGGAGQYSPPELVKYTFAALEAWGRDHDCSRPADQTPHEFARRMSEQFVPLAADTRVLADLYCRAVYASTALPTEKLEQVRRLWRTLHAIDAQLAKQSAPA